MRTIYSAIFHNFFIKIISLLLAILTWSYIAGQLYSQIPEIEEGSQTVVKLSDRNVIVKRLPVHVNLIGTPDRRYRVAIDRIHVRPSECVITGPPEKIEAVFFVTTEPISVANLTKSIRRKVKLKEIPDISINKEQEFYVVIPLSRKRIK